MGCDDTHKPRVANIKQVQNHPHTPSTPIQPIPSRPLHSTPAYTVSLSVSSNRGYSSVGFANRTCYSGSKCARTVFWSACYDDNLCVCEKCLQTQHNKHNYVWSFLFSCAHTHHSIRLLCPCVLASTPPHHPLPHHNMITTPYILCSLLRSFCHRIAMERSSSNAMCETTAIQEQQQQTTQEGEIWRCWLLTNTNSDDVGQKVHVLLLPLCVGRGDDDDDDWQAPTASQPNYTVSEGASSVCLSVNESASGGLIFIGTYIYLCTFYSGTIRGII